MIAAVLAALARQTGLEPTLINPNQPPSAIPEVESINLLLAFAEIEEAYSVLIPDDFLFGTATVQELADLVHRLAEGQCTPHATPGSRSPLERERGVAPSGIGLR